VILQKILVLHGPNLNLLGCRESKLYGSTTLEALNDSLMTQAASAGTILECKQTNAEHELIEFVQQARLANIAFIVINAAAYTHSSIGLRDALLAVQIPFIEVHITNVYAREDYRKVSYLADIATGVIVGLGTVGYKLALQAAIDFLNNKLNIKE
jgi:3-dehydroquinate dehydratase-2